MTNDFATNYRNPAYIRKAGFEALKEKLGIAGTVYFIRQFSPGYGDYTRERDALHADLTFDEIVKGVMEMDAKRSETP